MKIGIALSVCNGGARLPDPGPPVVESIAPTTRYSAGGQTVTIGGLDLKNPTAVKAGGSGGTALTVNASSRRSILATLPALTAGTYSIYVATALGNDTEAGLLEIVNAPAADLTSLSPNYGPASGGTLITATGVFVPEDLAFTVNGIACTEVTYVNGTTTT